jgi:hypothetical protein
MVLMGTDPPKPKQPPGWLASSSIDTSTPPTQHRPSRTLDKPTSRDTELIPINAQAGPSRFKPLSAYRPDMIMPRTTQAGMIRKRSSEDERNRNTKSRSVGQSVSGGEEVLMGNLHDGLEPQIPQSPFKRPTSHPVIAQDIVTVPRQSHTPAKVREPSLPPRQPSTPARLVTPHRSSPDPPTIQTPPPSILPPAPNQMASTSYRGSHTSTPAQRRKAAEDLVRSAKRAKMEEEATAQAERDDVDARLKIGLILPVSHLHAMVVGNANFMLRTSLTQSSVISLGQG